MNVFVGVAPATYISLSVPLCAPISSITTTQRAVPQEDLNQLDDYNKATIAAHLHKRFKVQRPYTSLGNIVVAVNPFEWLDLYDDDLGLAYQEPGRRDLPAHIYKSTAAAYR